MIRICAVLTGASIQPGMRSNTIAVKENFNHIFGKTDIHLLFDVFVGARVVLKICGDVIVILYSGNLPCCQFIWSVWQGKQKRLFLCKCYRSAAIFLLKWLVIELEQLLSDRFVQLAHRQKLLVSQSSQYPCGDNAEPSTVGLSLGDLTRAGITAVP